MAALTADRDTKKIGVDTLPVDIDIPVAASTQIFKGALVGYTVAGYAQGMVGSLATQIAAGRAEDGQDNSAGANGAKTVKVRPGAYKWANSGANPVVQAQMGRVVYAEDDQTVGNVAGTNSVAGIALRLDTDGVVVLTIPQLV